MKDIKKRKPEGELSKDQSDTEMDEQIDVTFEFCDLAALDYHAIKHLISQLFRIDREPGTNKTPSTTQTPSKAPLKPVVEDLDVAELTALILGEQKEWVGSTIKCDEDDCDPYAFISVLDLREYQEKSSVQGLTGYLSSVLTSSARTSPQAEELLEIFQQSLKPQGGGIGLVMSERLINMPVQVMPQLFTQLGREIKHAQSKKARGFQFDRLLIPSRVFMNHDQRDEINPTFQVNSHKKHKFDISSDDDHVGLYHPEDEVISQFASHTIHFSLSKSHETPPKNKNEDLGIGQQGRLMLISLSRWDEMVNSLTEFIQKP